MIATSFHLSLWGATERKPGWSHKESHTALKSAEHGFYPHIFTDEVEYKHRASKISATRIPII